MLLPGSPQLQIDTWIINSLCLIGSSWLSWTCFQYITSPCPAIQHSPLLHNKGNPSHLPDPSETPALDLCPDFFVALNPGCFPQLTKPSVSSLRESVRAWLWVFPSVVPQHWLTRATAVTPAPHWAPAHLFKHSPLRCKRMSPCLRPHPGHNRYTSLTPPAPTNHQVRVELTLEDHKVLSRVYQGYWECKLGKPIWRTF